MNTIVVIVMYVVGVALYVWGWNALICNRERLKLPITALIAGGAIICALVLSSCKPTYSMGGHVNCHPLTLPANIEGWDYVGRNATKSHLGEWHDNRGVIFGYALEEDSPIHRNARCLR